MVLADPEAAVDRELSAVSASFDYLLAVTPVNADDERRRFAREARPGVPRFRYADLGIDIGALRRRLDALPLDEVDDPDLVRLFAAKRREVALWLDLVEFLDRPRFVEAGLELYGAPDNALLSAARDVLSAIPLQARRSRSGRDVDGRTFALYCEDEVARYRVQLPGLPTQVVVDPSFPGVMVSGADVVVGPDHRVELERVEALVQHEVGTHVVTNVSGAGQPLTLLSVGLPGYEETQEGLAVLAEYAVDGLTAPRLALLAARVLAASRLVDGAPFAQVYRELTVDVGLREDRAWETAMRTWRGGGLTKDVIYLRGLLRVLRYLAEGGAVSTLTVGKLDLADAAAVERLTARGILSPPLLRPRWLDHPAAPPLLEIARRDGLDGVLREVNRERRGPRDGSAQTSGSTTR